jgi:hypothetical protein
VVLFGEVVQADGVERCFGDALGAVDEGGDGGLAMRRARLPMRPAVRSCR